jgi:arylsulfatase A-like enzyme
VGAYGDPVIKTPICDRIAKAEILFEYVYISSPSYTPSRNTILTGQYHWRLGPGLTCGTRFHNSMRPTRICLRTRITTQVIGANRGNLENSRASGHKAIALLEEMGLLDSTMIIITDDHGMRTPTTALLKQILLIIKIKTRNTSVRTNSALPRDPAMS